MTVRTVYSHSWKSYPGGRTTRTKIVRPAPVPDYRNTLRSWAGKLNFFQLAALVDSAATDITAAPSTWSAGQDANTIDEDLGRGGDTAGSMLEAGSPFVGTFAGKGGAFGGAGASGSYGGAGDSSGTAGDQYTGGPYTGPSIKGGGELVRGLMKRGFTRDQAIAIAANVGAESGYKTDIQDYKKSGHWGYMQWSGARLAGLKRYAASKGKDWRDPEMQMDWIRKEYTGESKKDWGGTDESAAFQRALGSGSWEQMAYEMADHVERPSKSELASSMKKRLGYGAGAAKEAGDAPVTPTEPEAKTPDAKTPEDKTGEAGGAHAVTPGAPSRSVVMKPAATGTVASPKGSSRVKIRPGTNINQVNQQLLDVVLRAADMLPPGYTMDIISGRNARPNRPGSRHPYGQAIDVQIYGPGHKAIPNLGYGPGTEAYKTYAQYAQNARALAEQLYGQSVTWGGHFRQGVALDLMHMQAGGPSAYNFADAEMAAANKRATGYLSGAGAGSPLVAANLPWGARTVGMGEPPYGGLGPSGVGGFGGGRGGRGGGYGVRAGTGLTALPSATTARMPQGAPPTSRPGGLPKNVEMFIKNMDPKYQQMALRAYLQAASRRR